jgi:hypothetical protein
VAWHREARRLQVICLSLKSLRKRVVDCSVLEQLLAWSFWVRQVKRADADCARRAVKGWKGAARRRRDARFEHLVLYMRRWLAAAQSIRRSKTIHRRADKVLRINRARAGWRGLRLGVEAARERRWRELACGRARARGDITVLSRALCAWNHAGSLPRLPPVHLVTIYR